MRRSIDATTTIRSPLEQACQVLIEDPGTVLSGACSREARRQRRFPVMLAVAVGGGSALQQEVVIEVAAGHRSDDGFTLPLRWRPSGHERLVPSFDGELVLSGDPLRPQLTLRGTYDVPLGMLGRFGDGLAGRRLARRSLHDHLEQVAQRLDHEVDRRSASVSRRPTAYAIAVHEGADRSEHFIG